MFPESYSSSFCFLTFLPFLSICLFVPELILKSSYLAGMVIIGRRKSKSTFGDNACIRGWAGGAEGGYHGGGGRIFGIFCTSFAGCVNIL